jgi:hypothetical protein
MATHRDLQHRARREAEAAQMIRAAESVRVRGPGGYAGLDEASAAALSELLEVLAETWRDKPHAPRVWDAGARVASRVLGPDHDPAPKFPGSWRATRTRTCDGASSTAEAPTISRSQSLRRRCSTPERPCTPGRRPAESRPRQQVDELLSAAGWSRSRPTPPSSRADGGTPRSTCANAQTSLPAIWQPIRLEVPPSEARAQLPAGSRSATTESAGSD